MINNDLCASCNKVTVCRINDVLYKFHEDAKERPWCRNHNGKL